MKQETLIREAVKLYRNTFCDWARIVQGVPVTPNLPKVDFHPGRGWFIDNVFEAGSAADIVEGYSLRMRQIADSIQDYRIGPRKVRRSKQLRDEAQEATRRASASAEEAVKDG